MLDVIQNKEDQILQHIRKEAKKGMKIPSAIEELSTKGVSITHSIRIIRIVYGLSLAEAKKRVESHPVWNEMVGSTQPYHEELMDHLHELSNEERQKISSYTYTHKVYTHEHIKHG